MLLFYLADNIDLRRSEKNIALINLSIYYTWENVKRSYKKTKFKISAPAQNYKLELPDGSYFVPDIQDYCENINEKDDTFGDDHPIKYIFLLTKLNIELHLKLKLDIIQYFQHLKL